MIKKYYSLDYLKGLPTLAQKKGSDLKIKRKYVKVWLSKCPIYEHLVTVEKFVQGKWVTWETYPARDY